jgi:hypothetical protein
MTDVDVIELNIDDLTMRDIKKIEALLGRKAGSLFAGGLQGMDADTLAAVIWVFRQKVDPEYTFEQALDVPFTKLREAPSDPLARTNSSARRSRTTSSTRQK